MMYKTCFVVDDALYLCVADLLDLFVVDLLELCVVEVLDLCVVVDDVLERVGLDELLQPDLVQLEVRNRLSQLNTGHLCRNITTFKL